MRTKISLAKIDLLGVEKVVCNETRNLCEHKVPGLDGSIFQDMGGNPVKISIFGSVYGDQLKNDFLTAVRGKYLAANPVIFVSDTTEGTNVNEVLIKKINVFESASQHDILNYEISLAEYVAPPADAATSVAAVDTEVSANAENRFDSLVDDVVADEMLGDFSEEFSVVPDMDSLLDKVPTELLDGLKDLLGVGYEERVDVLKDLTSSITTSDDGLDVTKTIGGMTKIAAKLVVTALTTDDKSDWIDMGDEFKKVL